MALVAYDNSDSSEYEDDERDSTKIVTLVRAEEPSTFEQSSFEKLEEINQKHDLFNQLPQPTNKRSIISEDDDEYLHKKANVTNIVKSKAKITVPSLSDFKDVEDSVPTSKNKASNGKKSGLLSILPQPKNGVTLTTTSLIPNVLKQSVTTVKKKEPIPTPNKKTKTKAIKSLALDYSDDSENEIENDFFSINKSVQPLENIQADTEKILSTEVPVITSPQYQTPSRMQSYFKKDSIVNNEILQTDHNSMGSETLHHEEATTHIDCTPANNANSEEITLDEEAIRKLIGARGKRKMEDIQIVDVNQQEVLADAREWLLKGLMDDTSKRVSSSKKSGNEPTSQQRRKHQITYLAHQAKANEIELQNQWANNRMSKRQTQSKYGF